MTKFYLFFLLIVSSHILFAQNITQKWSASIKKSSDAQIVNILYNQDEIVLLIKNDKDKNYLRFDLFDTTSVFLETIELRIDAQEVFKTFAVNNEIIVFCLNQSEDKKMDELGVRVFSKKGEKLLSKTLFSVPSNGGYRNNFDVNVSPNGSFFGVICSDAFNEKLNENIRIKIFDRRMDEIQSKEILTPLISDKKRVNVPVVNNNGTVFILKKYKIKMDNHYMIYSVDKNGYESKTDLKLRIKKIADFLYTFDEEGNLLLGGFFSSTGKINFEGVFTTKFSPNLQSVYLKEYMLPENVITAFKSKKEIDNFGAGLDNFKVCSFKYINENQLVLVAEHHSAFTDPKEGFKDYRKGIITLSFTPEGGYLYGTPVLTEQQDGLHKGYWSSFTSFKCENSFFIIFNNIGPSAKKFKSTATNDPLFSSQMQKINNSGTVTSSPIEWSTPIEKAAMRGELQLDLPTFKVVIVEQESKNQYSLGKIIIND